MTDAEVDASARAYYEAEYNYRAEEREALAEAAKLVRSQRGRWMVVYEGGGAVRHGSRRRATAAARYAIDAGVPARVIRYRRDRVWFDETMPGLEVNDSRWFP